MEAALGVLRAAVEARVDHIDTGDVYGPHITNQIIKNALHPYPQNLTIATKVGARRGEDGSWIPDFSPASIRSSVEDNLRNLKLEFLRLVNLLFPLGGFPPVQSSVLDSAAPSLKRTPFAVALAWLLQRASNILLIPDKSSAEHLRENIEAASLVLSEDAIAELNDFGRTTN